MIDKILSCLAASSFRDISITELKRVSPVGQAGSSVKDFEVDLQRFLDAKRSDVQKSMEATDINKTLEVLGKTSDATSHELDNDDEAYFQRLRDLDVKPIAKDVELKSRSLPRTQAVYENGSRFSELKQAKNNFQLGDFYKKLQQKKVKICKLKQ